MKKITTFLFALVLCIGSILGTTPVIIMTTAKAIGSTFNFGLGANASKTPIQVDFGDGTLVDDTIGTSPIAISGTLASSQTVKVYGAKINYLDCSNNQLIALDVTQDTALTWLYCYSNQLTSLDVTQNTALTRLLCDENKLTVLDVSKNTELNDFQCSINQLTVLDISKDTALINFDCDDNQLTSLDVTNCIKDTALYCSQNQLTSLDVSKNRKLTWLECRVNKITTLDVSQNTALTALICDSNQLSTLDVTNNIVLIHFDCYDNLLTALDVTKNTTLTELNCHNNPLSALDVSKNTALTYLACLNNHLTSIDVTKNTALIYFYCDENQITILDVSKNTVLTSLTCDENKLTTLDVSKNKALTNLECEGNQFTFVTLPLKQTIWTTYYYTNQQPISIVKNLNTGVELDLSSQLSVNGNTTVYTWKTKSGTTLVQGTDYTISNGKTIFLKTQADSVYCKMTNAAFPDFTSSNALNTTNTKVTGNTAVENTETFGLEIYSQYKALHITSPYNAQFSVFDINGKLIMSGHINSGTNNFQLQNTGVYLVKVTGNKGSFTRKIFVE
jgi:hypothetical protein